jgi:hypothetical protein
MRNFIHVVALLGLFVSAQAQVWKSGNVSNGVTTPIENSPFALSYVQLINTEASAVNTITLYDAKSGLTNRVLPTFTARIQSPVTVTNVYTDFNGNSVTNIFETLSVTTSTVAASTNEATRLYRITLPAGATAVLQPDEPLTGTYGLTLLGTGAGTYNMRYRLLP